MRLWALVGLLAAGCAGTRPGLPTTYDTARSLFEAKRFGDVTTLLSDRELRDMSSRDLARGYELLGRSHERLGHPDAALKTYQIGVAQFPKDVNLLTHLGNLLHYGGLDAQARPYYERILALSPQNAAAHLGLAETESRLGFNDRAAAHYEATLKTWKDQPGLWLDYAQVLSDSRRNPEALEALAQAGALADTGAIRVAKARVLWRLARSTEAFAELDGADRLEPGRLDVAQQRGLWALEAGDLELADSSAGMILKLKTDEPLGFWLRGAAQLRRGRTAEARRDLERAAAQRSAPFVAEAARGMLKELP